MIYALKLLVVVFTVGCIAQYLFRNAFRDIFSPVEYKRAWTLLLLGVVASYLCKLPVVFLVVVAVIAIYGANAVGRGPAGKVAVFLLMVVALPPIRLSLGGFGSINYVLSLDPPRMLALVLLGWAAIELASMKAVPRAMRFFWIDIFVVGYQVLRIALVMPHSTFTTLARLLVETTLDILLPYFVITRSLRSLADLRFAAGHLLVGLAFAASVGVAELALQHNLYSGLQAIYDMRWQLTYVLMRGGLIRVQSDTPQPIILAFMMLFGIGLWYWLLNAQWRRPAVAALFATFALTLVATFSRGPWLAAGLIMVALFAMRRMSVSVFRIFLIVAVLAAVGLKLGNADTAVMSSLSALFGSSETDISSIEYRRQLLDTSLALIKQSPWLGVPNYAAQMQALKQGEGIIDLVNSYLAIMLDAGIIGLALYLFPFLMVIHRLLSALRQREESGVEKRSRFAMAMIALTIGCLFAIFTASSWGIMPLLLTLLLAFSMAWLGMSPEERNSSEVRVEVEDPVQNARRLAHQLSIGARVS